MTNLTEDQVGRLAEVIAAYELARPVKGRYRRPLFRATPLGDKYPVVDCIVDVLGPEDVSLGFFFIQVKGTALVTTAEQRLPVEISLDRFNELVRVPAPTYVVGVDVLAEVPYLIAAHRRRKTRMSSMGKRHCLRDEAVKIRLYKEVLGYWKVHRAKLRRTEFKDV